MSGGDYISLHESTKSLQTQPQATRVANMTRSGVMLCRAAQAIIAPQKSANSDIGVCIVVDGVSSESYFAFKQSLASKAPLLRYYATSVPNAAVSELCLNFRFTGPAVTFLEDNTEPKSLCPPIHMAHDWLARHVTTHVIVGAITVNVKEADFAECVLIKLTKKIAAECTKFLPSLAPAPNSITLLKNLADAVGLVKAELP